MNIDFSVFCNNLEDLSIYKIYDHYYSNFYDDHSNFFINCRNFYNQANYSFYDNFLISNYQLTFETEGDSFNIYRYINSSNNKDEINDIINENLNLSFIIFENENKKENELNRFQKKKKTKIKIKRKNAIKYVVKYKYNNIECLSKYPILLKILYKFISLYLNSKRYFSKIGMVNKYVNKSITNYNILFYLKKIRCKRKYILIKLRIYNKMYHFIHKEWYKIKIKNDYFKLKIRYN